MLRRRRRSWSCRSSRPAATASCAAAHGQRPLGGEVERDQPRRRLGGDHRGRGRVAHAGGGAAVAERGDQPPLDLHRALELDQLLGDRAQQRLPRVRLAAYPQRAVGPHSAPDHGVAAEAVPERPQVVVDARGEAQPRDAGARGGLGRRHGRRTGPGRAPAARCRPAPARRRSAAAAGAPRRGGAAGRPSKRRRGRTATPAAPPHGARPRVTRGGSGGRRPGRSSTRRSALPRPTCGGGAAPGHGGAARPPRWRRRRRSPVAASAAAWRAGISGRAGSIARGSATTGRPSTTSASSSNSPGWLTR